MSQCVNMDEFQLLDIFCRQLVVCGRKQAYVDIELWLISRHQSPIFQLALVLSRRKVDIRRPLKMNKMKYIQDSLWLRQRQEILQTILTALWFKTCLTAKFTPFSHLCNQCNSSSRKMSFCNFWFWPHQRLASCYSALTWSIFMRFFTKCKEMNNLLEHVKSMWIWWRNMHKNSRQK